MIENYVRNGEVARVRRRSSLVLRVLWYVMQYPRKLLDDFMDEVSVYVCVSACITISDHQMSISLLN